ncbi:MAG: hypothetical protein HQK53_06350 [Oligoflexia bacterium]|nr:hypothetical protein [Oligoflexia bacterium]
MKTFCDVFTNFLCHCCRRYWQSAFSSRWFSRWLMFAGVVSCFFMISVLWAIPLPSGQMMAKSSEGDANLSGGQQSLAIEKSIPQELRYPANIFMMDEVHSHHVMVVEKATHRLHLFRNEGGYPTYLQSYQIATGQTAGDKSNRGDLRTPEGIYQLTNFQRPILIFRSLRSREFLASEKWMPYNV